MADPVTLSLISMGTAAAGGAVGGLGAIMGGASQKAMYQYQAGIALQNQKIAQQNRDYALQTGEINAAQAGMAGRAQLGHIIAAQGASGFLVNAGTNAKVQEGQKLITNTNETIIRSNAAKAAYDYDIGAVQAGEQASAYSAAAKNAVVAGDIGAASSILGTAGSVSSKWLQGQQEGIF